MIFIIMKDNTKKSFENKNSSKNVGQTNSKTVKSSKTVKDNINNRKSEQKKKESNLKSASVASKEKLNQSDSDGPSWFHYLIILGILVLLVLLAIFISEWHYQSSEVDLNKTVDLNNTYIYKFKQGNVTYNVHLGASTTDLDKYNFSIEPTKYDVLNTLNFRFSFDTYNGSDNGQVSMSAIKLRRFLSSVYNFKFDANSSFHSTDNITCENSTSTKKIVTFNPRSSNSGVFLDSNGCMMINSTQPNLLPFVVDSLMVKIMEG